MRWDTSMGKAINTFQKPQNAPYSLCATIEHDMCDKLEKADEAYGRRYTGFTCVLIHEAPLHVGEMERKATKRRREGGERERELISQHIGKKK